MERFVAFAQQGNVLVVTSGLSSTTVVEGSYPLCTVTINLHSGGLATIYSDNGVTPLANPFTADANGQFAFYAANNRYDAVLSNNAGSGPASPITISDILLNDPAGGGGTVNSVFGRTGTVIAQTGDYTVAQVTGAAPLAAPIFILSGGTFPTSPTPTLGDNTTKIATTAFVTAAIPATGVTSFNSRTGVVVPTSGDYTVGQVTGAAPAASPTFTGTVNASGAGSVTVPTVGLSDNSTNVATTAFVKGQGYGTGGGNVSSSGSPSSSQIAQWVTSTSITGIATTGTGSAVLSISPALTGTPTAPTASIGDSSSKIATTQFVQQAGLSPTIFASVTLTSAQLKALNGTPITLVAAPGVGFVIYPIQIVLEYKFVTTAYTINGATLLLDYNHANGVFKQVPPETGFFDQGSSQISFLEGVIAKGGLTLVNNLAFTISGVGGTDMTLGDGTAVVYIYYVLITLQ